MYLKMDGATQADDKSLSIPPDCIIIDLIIKAVVNISKLTRQNSYYESRSFLVEKGGVGFEIWFVASTSCHNALKMDGN